MYKMNFKTEDGMTLKGVVLMSEDTEYYSSRYLMYCQNRLFYYNVELYCDDGNTENTQEDTSIDIISNYVVIPELDEFLNKKSMQECMDEIEFIRSLYRSKPSGWWQEDPLDGLYVQRKIGEVYNLGDLIFIVQDCSILVIEDKDLFSYLNWTTKDNTLNSVLDEAPGFIIKDKDRDAYIRALDFKQREYIKYRLAEKSRKEENKLLEDYLPF